MWIKDWHVRKWTNQSYATYYTWDFTLHLRDYSASTHGTLQCIYAITLHDPVSCATSYPWDLALYVRVGPDPVSTRGTLYCIYLWDLTLHLSDSIRVGP